MAVLDNTLPRVPSLPKQIVADRLLRRRKVTETGCWEFTGAHAQGYGCIRISTRTYTAHRMAAWIWMHAELRGGHVEYICHRCDNRLCFNPDHLYIGTPEDNSRDMMLRGRGKRQIVSEQVRGTKHFGNILSELDVAMIRQKIQAGAVLSRLAEEFGVTVQQISRIKYKRAWKWL